MSQARSARFPHHLGALQIARLDRYVAVLDLTFDHKLIYDHFNLQMTQN